MCSSDLSGEMVMIPSQPISDSYLMILTNSSRLWNESALRKRERLTESLGAVTLNLSGADLAQIDRAIPADAVAGDRYAPMLMERLDSEQ